MTNWLPVLVSSSSLIGIAGVIIFTLAFWKLHLLAPTAATRGGLIGTFIHLGVWLVFGTTWALDMIPGFAGVGWFMYRIPYLPEAMWAAGTLSSSAALLCLAWTLHHGIHPAQPPP